jgi:hypothetical protein
MIKLSSTRKHIQNATTHRQLDTGERLLAFELRQDGFQGHLLTHLPTEYSFSDVNARREFLINLIDRII